ncbi:MAG: UDP-N-acetylglucosamine--N-acetylmuramyl-(pentapeptide) pyrophosphoryl-undecaprenol N-acetylglucosamine transferase [Patescibacteria group bacterium]
MKILFTGGGSGGHLFPIIAVARELKRLRIDDDQFFYLGPKDDFADIVLGQEGITVKALLAGKARRYLNFVSFWQNVFDILIKAPLGFCQAFGYILYLNPDIVFCKGGYGSLSAGISAWLLRIPVFLHESDAVAGLANRILARVSASVFTSFPETEFFPQKMVLPVGNPIRREILGGRKEEAKLLARITGARPVVLFMGGSQGARRLNDLLIPILSELLAEFEIIHQAGEKNFQQLSIEVKTIISESQKLYYHLVPFLKETDLKHIYSVCDLVVSRAGSGIIFELAALGMPSILVPLPESAQNHQVKNAYVYAANGAAMVIEEANLTERFFLEKIRFLFSHPEEMALMKEQALKFAKPDAAAMVAEEITKYLI